MLVDRVHRDPTDQDIGRIVAAYQAWRGDKGAGTYEDVLGVCKSASFDEVRSHGHVLTPGRYVRAEEIVDDVEPFEATTKRLVGELTEQFAESARLEAAMAANLASPGYPIHANGRSRE